jgi:hypothetical protein
MRRGNFLFWRRAGEREEKKVMCRWMYALVAGGLCGGGGLMGGSVIT